MWWWCQPGLSWECPGWCWSRAGAGAHWSHAQLNQSHTWSPLKIFAPNYHRNRNKSTKKILEYLRVFVDNVTNVNPLNPVDTIHGHNQLHSLTVLILRNCHEPPITPHCLYTALYCTSSSDKLSPEYYISIIISFFLIL